MADGEKKTISEADIGIIRKAMALQVKYRIAMNGKTKRRIPIAAMGVHPSNRGGVYCNEDRVVGLNGDIQKWGADQDEADHNGVTVEEIPDAERAKHPQLRLERYTEYNKRKCKDKPCLKTCFEGGDVLYGNFSHNHLLLVLLSWANAAKWDIPEFCDPDGNLHLPKVTDSVFVNLVKEGLLMEKLSYKMLIEEPDAASLLSQALNKGQEAACRTSELTALAVLTGQVTEQSNAAVAGEVMYATVKEKLRSELDYYVDEPEFIEMFDFVVSVGANNTNYVKELLDFGDRFVDSKFRQLRLNAFTEVNKMPPACPRSKIAAMKRAYRKKPSYGFCPSPEGVCSKIEERELRDLEDLLHYFHVKCEPAVADAVSEGQRLVFFANLDVAAAEAFITNHKSKDRQQPLLQAVAKYHEQLAEHSLKLLPKLEKGPDERYAWIDFTKMPAASGSKGGASTTAVAVDALKPKILRFDDEGNLIGGGREQKFGSQSAEKRESVAALIN